MTPAAGLRVGLAALAALAAAGALLAAEPAVVERLDVAPVWSGHPVGFAIETAGDRQYVAFYDADRWMTVAARDLDSDQWTLERLPSRLGWDSHGEVVLATDRAGFLHVAGNMHGDPLVYFRSQRPHDAASLTRRPMIGSREKEVTYPRFVRDAVPNQKRSEDSRTLKAWLELAEAYRITQALRECGGNRSAAAASSKGSIACSS